MATSKKKDQDGHDRKLKRLADEITRVIQKRLADETARARREIDGPAVVYTRYEPRKKWKALESEQQNLFDEARVLEELCAK